MASRTMVGSSRKRSAGAFAAGITLAALLAGCASEQLVPLGATEQGEAKQTEGGVQVRAAVKASAKYYLPNSITPMKITVHNGSPDGVYVELEDILLVADGHALTPLPPMSIEPRDPMPSLGLDPASPFTPQLPASAAAAPIAGSGGAQGPGTLYEPSIVRPGSSQEIFRLRARTELARGAFTGGFIDSGQSRQGIVYFSNPPKGTEHVDLQVKARSGEGSAPAVVVEIPYTVEG